MTLFDERVAQIRLRGVAPKHKPYGKKKADCTAEQWASHLEYIAARYRDPVCRAAHRVYQSRYLARKGLS